MASNTRPRQPRLRASCDGCFIAKVKCSKARPICSRCLACGLECRYSPSSRAGKPRYDAHNATTQQQPGMSHQGMGRVPEDGTILYHNAYAPPIDLYRLDTGWNTPPSLDGSMGRGAGAGMSAPNDQTRSDHDGGMNLYGIGVSPWLSAADVQQSSFSEISFGQGSFTPNMAHSPYSETGGLSIPLVSPWAVAGNNSSQHEVRLYDMSNSLPTPASLGSNCFPSPSATPSVPQCHQSGGMGGPAASISACTCVSFCLESLQGLHNASATSTPSLDMILSLNRKAVESCAALLSCPRCTSPSGTPTVAMLFATILGEAAGFYKMAAHMHFDKPWGVPPNSPLPPPSQQEGGDTSPTALQGQEGLQQGQEALWAELETLARELDRLEEICSRFRDVCNDLSDDAEVNRAMVGYVSRTVGATMEAIERRQAARFG